MARTALATTVVVAIAAAGGIAAYGDLGEKRVAPAGQPTPAPDKLAFVSDRDGDADVYSAMVGDGPVVNLTHDDATDASPSWSPDGSQIAFASDRSGTWAVYVMQEDGSEVHLVVTDASHPAWSPDGGMIAFQRVESGSNEELALSQVFVLKMSTGAVDQITHDEAGAVQPEWSAEGTQLAYSAQGRIVIADATGADERALTNRALDMHPLWSPDGSLVFARETAFEDDRVISNVFSVEPVGGPPHALTSLAGRSVSPESFSPDGARLLVTVYDADGTGDVYVMDSDGSNLALLIESPSNDAEAAWGPQPLP